MVPIECADILPIVLERDMRIPRYLRIDEVDMGIVSFDTAEIENR